MSRTRRLALAIVGLAGLVAWWGWAMVVYIHLLQRLRGEGAVMASPSPFVWLRFGLLPLAVVLAVVVLVQCVRGRPVRWWSLAVFVVLIGPLFSHGALLRWVYVPYLILAGVFLALGPSGRLPAVTSGGHPLTRRD